MIPAIIDQDPDLATLLRARAMPQGKRLPTNADFPSGLKLTIVPPSNAQTPTNVLILLHGLGDDQLPFGKLGQQLNLPQTVCIALRGISALPFETTRYHWCGDVIFDSSTNGLDPDGGFKTAIRVLMKEIIQDGLVAKCGHEPRDILILGFGQGGMLALNIAANLDSELAGIVSIGGALPSEANDSKSPKRKTPVLLCAGQDSHYVTPGAVERIKRVFEYVQLSNYRRVGDSMPKNRDEMLPVMQFFARRLRQSAPKGFEEVT